jgi:hypothetical protein
VVPSIVIIVEPELGMLLASPLYVAVIVVPPNCAPVTVMEHEPVEERVQVGGLGKSTLPAND